MNRFLLLLLIAGLVFLIVLFAARPDLLDNVWLWVVGLIGGIVKAFKSLIEYFKHNFNDDKADGKEEVNEANEPAPQADATTHATSGTYDGITLKILRFAGDGDTTTGLLLINDSFFCYTLEDAHHEPKIPGETRIPQGTYPVVFRKEDTDFTAAYRKQFPGWFTYHLLLKNVPGFNNVYIHEGGDHTNTEGCIMVTNILNAGTEDEALAAARGAFQKLYGFLQEKLDNNIPVRLVIKDEQWIKQLN